MESKYLMKKNNLKKHIDEYLEQIHNVLKISKNDKVLLILIENIVFELSQALSKGKKIIMSGNGGSAADAQHIVAEFICRFKKDRVSLPAISLNSDVSVLTSIANDYGYENIFSRQIESLANKGDIYWTFSTSGKSKNVIKSLQLAKSLNIKCIGFTGSNNSIMEEYCDYLVEVPSKITCHIQEMHIILAHLICDLVEQDFAE